MPKWTPYLDELDEDNEDTTERFEKFGKKKGGKPTIKEHEGVELRQKEKRVDEKRKGRG